MKTKLNWVVMAAVVIVCFAGGCTTKGKVEPAVTGNQGPSIPGKVLIVGGVQQSVIPWSNGLTLSKALVQAGYRSNGQNGRAGVVRKGQQTIYFNIAEVLQGQDVLLESGDRVEIQK